MEQEHKANLDVLILCGGLGTRLKQSGHNGPKPMVEIGGKPIIWHILKSSRKLWQVWRFQLGGKLLNHLVYWFQVL